MLKDLEEIDIEPTVKSVFQRATDTLLAEARRRDQEPDTVFGILSSELLDDPIPLEFSIYLAITSTNFTINSV